MAQVLDRIDHLPAPWDVREAGREGMHHFRFRVDDTDHWVEKLRPLGYEAVWYKRWSADTVFAYLERAGDPTLIEFLQMPAGGPGA